MLNGIFSSVYGSSLTFGAFCITTLVSLSLGAQLTRVKTVNMGSLYSLKYQVRLKEAAKEKQLLDAMRCRNGNLEISSGLPAEPKDGERL